MWNATGGVAMVAALLVVSGCSMLRSTIGAYETGPDGIARPQQQLREALVRADFVAALGSHEDDALLRALEAGASSYYAAQYERSVLVLDSAALIADDRITNSVSANAIALVTNDMARPYQARRTERLFIPYYAMLAYARLERWEDAAVEARRLGGLLAQYAGDRNDAERATHATLHYLTGVVFERAGERSDAQVAYRLARALLPDQVDSARGRVGKGDGEILVVLERGFVAHRATETISLFLGESDRDVLEHGDGDESAGLVRRITDKLSQTNNSERAPIVGDRSGGPRREREHHDDDGYWLRVSFPSMRRAPRFTGEPTMMIDGERKLGTRIGTVLDDAVSADEGRERTALLGRAVARAAAKYAVTKAVKDNKGEVAGSIANIGTAFMDRADIRSWHVLPQTVTLLRVRVPAGQRVVHVNVDDGMEGVDLGEVLVRPGQLTIVSARAWRETARARQLAAKR